MTKINPHIQRESAQRLYQLHKRIRDHSPFFSPLILRLSLVPDANRQTIAVDGRYLLYNPEWVSQQNIDALEGALTRLTLACALNHHTRRGDRDYGIWQEASKQTTRHVLRFYELEGWQAETGPSLEMTVEKAYDFLYQQAQDTDSQSADGGQEKPKVAGSGGATDAQVHPYNDCDGQGEVLDAPAKDEPGQQAHRDSLEKDRWEQALSDAAHRARQAGHKASKMAEDIARAKRPPMDWKEILRSLLTQAADKDYTWSQPNRRYVHHGIYLPARKSRNTLPPIIFAVDTSGSVKASEVAEVWAELQSIAADLEPEQITVIQCDADIQSVAEYDSWDVPLDLTINGRGGTNFRPVFDWVNQSPPPSCLIYCTDLYCSSYPLVTPDYPVIWLVQGNPPAQLNPPFGYRIDLLV